MASSVSGRLCVVHLASIRPRLPQKILLKTRRIGTLRWELRVRASAGEASDGTGGRKDPGRIERSGIAWERTVGRLRELVSVAPPVVVIKRNPGYILSFGLSVAVAMLVVILRNLTMGGHTNHRQRGSVADLVKRGQLRADRGGIARPLKYEDPFNNPLVKVRRSDSTVEMCGKVYKLAPVTLTDEQRSIHKMRRSRAYKWKRPTVFLKEGDEIPPNVDPDTVRWIPANHPFATTASDIDENLAQSNVYQTNGVPFRVRVEHEELQKKLETLQAEQKLNGIAITPSSFRDVINDEKPASSSIDSKSGQGDKHPHLEHHSSELNSLQENAEVP